MLITGSKYAHSLYLEDFLESKVKFTNIITKCFYFINVYDDIKPAAFSPKPKVDSSIVGLIKKPKITLVCSQDYYLLRELIEQNDKKIKNALIEGIVNFYDFKMKRITKNKAREIIDRLNIEQNILQNNIFSLNNEEIKKLFITFKNNSLHL